MAFVFTAYLLYAKIDHGGAGLDLCHVYLVSQ